MRTRQTGQESERLTCILSGSNSGDDLVIINLVGGFDTLLCLGPMSQSGSARDWLNGSVMTMLQAAAD